mmetsp:Transcript_16051/g.37861  ORF Transcript_16051/g.37861 Transcript_16051/m.37861 type:complete len:1051 (-) Transcript_16051:49-3201(-)
MDPTKREPQLLFENGDFFLYLHAADMAQDGYALQLRLKEGPPTSLEPDCTETCVPTSAQSEVLCQDKERGCIVRRSSSDIYVEFKSKGESATRRSLCQAESLAGCWYGCGEDEEEEEEEAMATSTPEASGVLPLQAPREEAANSEIAEGVGALHANVAHAVVPRILAEEEVAPQIAASASPLPEATEFDDRAWKNAVRLAAWAWQGCDLDKAPAGAVETEGQGGGSSGSNSTVPAASSEASPACQEDKGEATEAAGSSALLEAEQQVHSDGDVDDPSTEGWAWYFAGAAAPASTSRSAKESSGQASAPQTELERISPSKVEWRVWGISGKLDSYPKGSRIFSPEFEAFGVEALGLVFYPNGNSNAKQGFCSLGLKAPHGTHLRYKLYIGGTERFTDLRHNVTESWGFVDMCKVEDELQTDSDLLRLGVEIIDDIDAHESLKNVSSNKVEWVISNMQNKMAHYPKDIALYSDELSVGGVDKLRLKFYPAGKKEADAGWCSLYLEAPKGSELRCRLSVGKKSMSFDRLEKFGEDSIWGFLTVCKLQDELEQDGDAVRVGLEVMETKRLDGRLSESEDSYLKTLTVEKRTWLLGELDRVEKLRSSGDGSVPSRFRILQLEIPDQAKAVALAKLDTMTSDVLSGEGSKLKRWIDGLLTIPFGSITKPLVSIGEGRLKVQEYLLNARKALDEAVFGHEEPKQKIVQLLCQWIANPDSMSLVLGIQGPPGNGKTTLCRKGIAEALQRPFVQVSLGGATDASVLEGHSYTYVGSTWGRIAGLVMEAQCMNPVIFFDELDKVSGTPRGEEIIGVLTHLTDHSQNRTFTDRYFEGIPLDMSRALFIFSFNDESKLNHVLKDRLTIIHTDGFDMSAKMKISQEYLLPELLNNVGMKAGDVKIERDELQHLCHRCCVSTEEGGVRGIKQSLESVILHVNEIHLTQEDDEKEEGDTQKADAGVEVAAAQDDGGSAHKEEKAQAECRTVAGASGPHKADAGDATENKPSSSASKLQEHQTVAAKSGKDKKKRKIKLPLVLTKDLIDDLITQKTKKDLPAMMYI